jgi:hypothetical protein
MWARAAAQQPALGHRPVPIERPLLARAWIERKDPNKWHIAGELVLGSSGANLATASGVWVLRDHTAHFGGFKRWLDEQEGGTASG